MFACSSRFLNEVESCGSRLTRLLYSQNIQRGLPLWGVSWKWPKVTFYISISISAHLIFLLLANQNRYANGVLNMRIWWQQTTWVVFVPITTHIPCFINLAHTELWIFDFFDISQSGQICKWGIKYAHLVMTDHMGSTCAHHYPHTKFHQCSPYITLDIWLFCY